MWHKKSNKRPVSVSVSGCVVCQSQLKTQKVCRHDCTSHQNCILSITMPILTVNFSIEFYLLGKKKKKKVLQVCFSSFFENMCAISISTSTLSHVIIIWACVNSITNIIKRYSLVVLVDTQDALIVRSKVRIRPCTHLVLSLWSLLPIFLFRKIIIIIIIIINHKWTLVPKNVS